MERTLILLCLFLATVSGCAGGRENCIFKIVDWHEGPVINRDSPGMEGILYGLEGGRVLKLDGTYHMCISEMLDSPHWVKMRLAHWKSEDGVSWQRLSTLYESSGDFTGADPRASLWSPMPIYDKKEGRWNLFYVAYKCKENRPGLAWYHNHEGRIWHAVSTTPGIEGLGGPYEDVKVILEPGPDSDDWEGLQGVDAFCPYPVGNKWYAFYGSAHTQKWPCDFWGVGLASAPALAGPWKRESKRNPVLIDKLWVEKPVVTQIEDGTYILLFDGGPRGSFAYSMSKDGIHWSKGVTIELEPKVKRWWGEMRTPLGLIPEGDNTYTVFYTAYNESIFGCLGMVKLKLKN